MLNATAEMLASVPPAVEPLIRLTVLLTLVWSLARLVRRVNPRSQVLYWRGVAVAALLMPIAVLVGPTSRVPVLDAGLPGSAAVVKAEPISMAELSTVACRLAQGNDDAAETTGETIRVRGEVVDQDGKPMAGVTVYLREWPNYRISQNPGLARVRDVLAKTTTDRDGRFEFADVPARPIEGGESRAEAPWDVVCRHEGFGLAWQHLRAAKSEAPVRLRLGPEALVEGEVLDQSGNPVVGAHVEMYWISAVGSGWLPEQQSPWTLDLSRSELAPSGQSDAKGRVLLRGLPAGLRATLVITHDDFSRDVVYVAGTNAPQPPVPQPGRGPERVAKPTFSRRFSVEMKPAGPTVRGRVTLADIGAPCANALVAIRSSDHGNRYTVSDDDGNYILRDAFVPSEYLSVTPMDKSDYLGRRIPIELQESDPEKVVDVALPRGLAVTGTISVEETGQPVAGAHVFFESIDPESPAGVIGVSRVSDKAGGFRVVVPEGRSRLRIWGTVDGCLLPAVPSQADLEDSRYFRDINVIAGKAVEPVRFLLTRGKIVEGLVTDPKGKPVAGAEVRSLQNRNAGRYHEHETTTDASGRFELGGFKALAQLQLVVTHPDLGQGARIPIDESGDRASIEVTLQPTATFTGIVLVDGKPQADVSVNLEQTLQDGGREEWAFHQNTRTNNEGRYRFEKILPGSGYVVSIMTDQVTDANTRNLDARAGETRGLDPMEVVSRTASVSGIVVDPDGNPVEGVMVGAGLRSGKPLPGACTETPTGKDGRFFIGRLPDEPLTLTAYIRPARTATDRTIRATSRVDVEANATGVQIVFDPRLVRKTPIPVRQPK